VAHVQRATSTREQPAFGVDGGRSLWGDVSTGVIPGIVRHAAVADGTGGAAMGGPIGGEGGHEQATFARPCCPAAIGARRIAVDNFIDHARQRALVEPAQVIDGDAEIASTGNDGDDMAVIRHMRMVSTVCALSICDRESSPSSRRRNTVSDRFHVDYSQPCDTVMGATRVRR
jgi:hypothetical protein